MHLFTSNSKNKYFFVWLIVTTVIVFALYGLMVFFIPKSDDGPDQYQTNVLKAQRYMFGDNEYDYVMVGSSKANRVTIQDVNNQCYNLAFSGSSSFTGLEIIKEKSENSGIYPKIIFVEIDNSLINGIDDDILDKVSGKYQYKINQSEYRIDFAIYSLTKFIFYQINGEKTIYDHPKIESSIEFWQRAKSVLEDEDIILSYLSGVKEYVDYFEAHGTRVILLELPNDESLYDSVQCVQIRELAMEIFSEDIYEWYMVEWGNYTVSDGIHLGQYSGLVYAQELIQKYIN